MNTGNVVLLVFGAIVISIAIGIIVAGGTMVWVDSAIADNEGYLTTKTIKFDSDSSTILAEPGDVGVGPAGNLSGGDIVSFRIEPVDSGTSGSILGMLALFSNTEEPNTDLSIVFRAKVSWMFEVGMGLLISGLIILTVGAIAVFFALRNSLRQFGLWSRFADN